MTYTIRAGCSMAISLRAALRSEILQLYRAVLRRAQRESMPLPTSSRYTNSSRSSRARSSEILHSLVATQHHSQQRKTFFGSYHSAMMPQEWNKDISKCPATSYLSMHGRCPNPGVPRTRCFCNLFIQAIRKRAVCRIQYMVEIGLGGLGPPTMVEVCQSNSTNLSARRSLKSLFNVFYKR
ncbi:hypothetical protein BC832DRAFT_258102 [Gaertneriomyces semiglobifer]|nr:hypothetical protein BC832DRAFT_258102 [Gaertneriomyces semiglobifer]